MKKIISAVMILFCTLLVGGCNYKKVEVVNATINVSNKDASFISNVKETYQGLNGLNGKGTITYDNKEYNVEVSIIKNGTFENSFVSLKINDLDLYLKNKTVYIVYKTNVIVKDNLDDFIDEVCPLLNEKGLTCNEEKVKQFVKEESSDTFDFNFFNKITSLDENKTFNYKNLKVKFSDNYLVTNVSDTGNKVSYNISFDYDKITIEFKMSNELFSKSLSDYDLKSIIDKYYK